MPASTPTAQPDIARIPSEFRYREHVGDRRVQLARNAWKALWRFDPQPDEEFIRSFARGYYDSDPVAEAFVDEAYMRRGAKEVRRLLDEAIERGVDSISDAPESMARLFAEFERDPEWLDWGLVERGARVFRRYGTSVFSFATTSTLEMYSECSIAKPLSLAGGYAGDPAHKRQLETVRFWIDISEPGGLEKGPPASRGRGTALRVRIMHVFIRRRLIKHPEWDLEAWGVPISISDATLTLMVGSVVPGLALWSVGHQTTIAEIEALLHFWRYVGHLLGVQPEWYPRDFRESVQLMYAAFVKRAYAAGRDGEELVESYLPAFAPKPGSPLLKRIRDELNYRTQIGYTRFWLLPATYRRQQMPDPWPWALHPLIQFPFVLTMESFRRLCRRSTRLPTACSASGATTGTGTKTASGMRSSSRCRSSGAMLPGAPPGSAEVQAPPRRSPSPAILIGRPPTVSKPRGRSMPVAFLTPPRPRRMSGADDD